MVLTMPRAGLEMESAFQLSVPTGENLDLTWLGPAVVSNVVARTAQWAADARALPSPGRGSA